MQQMQTALGECMFLKCLGSVAHAVQQTENASGRNSGLAVECYNGLIADV
jgi:hypothetical protein